MQNKRQYVRWSVTRPVRYKMGNREKRFSSCTKDMSTGIEFIDLKD